MSEQAQVERKHQSTEGFCLMLYRTEDGLEQEWIWNSRDGVTPYTTMNRDGTKRMLHVEWNRDRYSPSHTPNVGDRVFVDATAERIAPFVATKVDRLWNGPQSDAYREHYGTEDALTAAMSQEMLSQIGAPMTIVVTEDTLTELGSERQG